MLSNLVTNYAYCGDYSILVDGHARKDEAAELSMGRANIVRRYFLDRGVAPRRVYVRGLGATEPASHGDPGKAQDSRVEVLIAPL